MARVPSGRFRGEPRSASTALAAANAGAIQLVDKRDTVWTVKAEWTTSPEIPKKPKKKRSKGRKVS